MEQVLNFPYEEKINPNTLVQIIQKRFPSYKVKMGKKGVEMFKNIFVSVRFTVKTDSDNRQLFYKTKMNIWVLAFILITYAFCGCYSWSEWGHYNDDDIKVITITAIVPIIVWIVYLIMKIGIVAKVRRALELEVPSYITNRVEFFFPPKSNVNKWKHDMLPVSLIICLWGITNATIRILVGIPVIARYISDYISKIQIYGNLISNLLLLSVAVVFVIKNYNHYWKVAKYIFLSYTIWMVMQSCLSVLGIFKNFESIILFLIVNAVESCVSLILMAVFACFFYRSLNNTSSLYLLKATVIWILFSVILLVDFSYFNLTYPSFSYDTLDYQSYKQVQQSYQLRIVIWSSVAGWAYIIGLAKAFFTLKDYVPQGIGIKID